MTEDKKAVYTELLNSKVVSEDLHSLLKRYKDQNKDVIRLSGTKSELIENIFESVEQNIFSVTEVQTLIKDSEEFGDQYIYVYEPINANLISNYNNGNQIGNLIIPSSERNNFPKIFNIPEEREWVDFRSPNRGDENTWLIKLYDKKTREEKEDERVNLQAGTRTVVYKKIHSRIIYIIEWNKRNELEIKISRTSFDSPKNLGSTLRKLEQLIARGININQDFKYRDFSTIVYNMLKKWEENKNIYILMRSKLTDSSGGYADISSLGEDEVDLLSDDDRKNAIDAYLGGKGKVSNLSIKFLASGSNKILSKDVNVIIGKHQVNEIIIPPSINPEEYNYVRKKIEQFS